MTGGNSFGGRNCTGGGNYSSTGDIGFRGRELGWKVQFGSTALKLLQVLGAGTALSMGTKVCLAAVILGAGTSLEVGTRV